jgi:hypothetical protein
MQRGLWLLPLQVVEWMQLLAERGTDSAGFKSTGFERFERVWTGQQVRCGWGVVLDVEPEQHLPFCMLDAATRNCGPLAQRSRPPAEATMHISCCSCSLIKLVAD